MPLRIPKPRTSCAPITPWAKKAPLRSRTGDGDGIGMIHRKNDDGRPLDGGLANRIRAFPPEVSRPLVPSRIEQPGDPPREGINPGALRALVSVIVEAGESKVPQGLSDRRAGER